MPDKHSNNDFSAWKRSRFSYDSDLKLFRVRFDWMINPRNGHEEKMIVLEGGDAAQVIAVNAQAEILLVRQYRFGIGEYCLELPGGLIDMDELPAQAAKRELQEETGYTSDAWESLGKHAANPVFMSGYIHHFLAQNVRLTNAPSLDLGEQIEMLWLPVSELRAYLESGRFLHPHTVCALMAFLAR